MPYLKSTDIEELERQSVIRDIRRRFERREQRNAEIDEALDYLGAMQTLTDSATSAESYQCYRKVWEFLNQLKGE